MDRLIMTQDSDGTYAVGIVNMPVQTGTIAKGLSELKALYLVTCWNDHDTLKAKAAAFDDMKVAVDIYEKEVPSLKAKAELLDEFTHHYQPMYSHIAHYIRMFEEQFPEARSVATMWASYHKLAILITKAKDLK